MLDDLDAELAEQAEAHPELEGLTVAAVWDVAGTFYVYTPEDSRVEFLSALGLEDAPAVAELANGESPFFYTLSYEQLDQLDSDLVISYHDTQEEADAFLASAPIQAIPAVGRGQVAQVVGTELIAAVSPPTALSLTYGLDELVTALSAAAAARGLTSASTRSTSTNGPDAATRASGPFGVSASGPAGTRAPRQVAARLEARLDLEPVAVCVAAREEVEQRGRACRTSATAPCAPPRVRARRRRHSGR